METNNYKYTRNRRKQWKRQMMMTVLGITTAAMAYWVGCAIETFDRMATETHHQRQFADVTARIDAFDARQGTIGLMVKAWQHNPFFFDWNNRDYSEQASPALTLPISQLSIVPQ